MYTQKINHYSWQRLWRVKIFFTLFFLKWRSLKDGILVIKFSPYLQISSYCRWLYYKESIDFSWHQLVCLALIKWFFSVLWLYKSILFWALRISSCLECEFSTLQPADLLLIKVFFYQPPIYEFIVLLEQHWNWTVAILFDLILDFSLTS